MVLNGDNIMDDYEFERNFWGDCCNTFGEDQKHFIYGNLMGLIGDKYQFAYNVNNKRILDIGGGPTSMLLKTDNLKEGKVCDPIEYPQWTKDRYSYKNISVDVICGEDINESGWDEVWMYNVLEHTIDPEMVVKKAMAAGKVFRIFEWIDIPPHEGHPHMITQEQLEKWIGQEGKIKVLDGENGCFGKCFYGVFNI
jgi:hypothetical protein